MTWWGILNPTAGDAGDVRERVQRALAGVGVEAQLRISESGAHLQELVDEGIDAGADGFLAVGGDGTVSLVADALLRRRPPEPPLLGILPSGSGCDFIRVFGIPQEIEGAARHLTGDTTYLADAAVVEGAWGARHFVNAADLGVIGATVKRASSGVARRLGRMRYLAAFWSVLPFFGSAEISLTMERRTFEGRAIAVVLANGQFFGSGLNIAPRATLVDGALDVQVFTGSRWNAIPIVPRVRRGLHLTHPSVKRFSSGELHIETDRPWPIEVDGDYLGETPVRVRVIPGALRIKI